MRRDYMAMLKEAYKKRDAEKAKEEADEKCRSPITPS